MIETGPRFLPETVVLQGEPSRPGSWGGTLLVALLFAAIAATSLYSYLLFHSLAEFFAIAVGLLTGVVAWHTHPLSRNDFFAFLGLSYACLAVIDLMHTLAFKGMGVFVGHDANLPTQLWMAGRGLQALVMLMAPLFLRYRLRLGLAVTLLGLLSALLIALPLLGYFPDAYIEGEGLTAFKIYGEYVIVAVMLAAAGHLWLRRGQLQPRVLALVLASIGLSILGELAFTAYVSVYGLANLIGHLFKLGAFWLLFLALIRTTLREPFSALRRESNTYNAIPEPVVLLDRAGRVCQVNRAAQEQLRVDPAQVLGRHVHGLLHSPAIGREACPVCSRLGDAQPCGDIEMELSGERWLSIYLQPVRRGDATAGIIHVSRDITARKGVEIATRRINRALYTISGANHALLHAEDEGELLRRFCEVAVEKGGYRLACVLLADDGGGFTRPAACLGEGTELIAKPEFAAGLTSLRETLADGRPLIISDLQGQGSPLPWAAAAADQGLGAAIALPLRARGRPPLGALLLFTAERQAFAAEELSILTELAGDLAFGLDALRTREAHDAALAELRKINRSLHAIIACSQAMAHSRDETELLAEVCRIVVEKGGYRMAWVGFCEDGPDRPIRPVAHAGFEAGYFDEVRFSWGDDRWGQGPAGVSGRTGMPEIVNDVANDPRVLPWREAALRRGYAAIMAFPLQAERGDTRGVLVIYHDRPQVFTEEEVKILQQLAADLAYGIDSWRARDARDKAEADARDRMRRLSEAMEQTVEAMAALVEQRDPYTAGHQRRVAALAEAIGRRMGLDENRLKGLHLGGVVHDIGKISVPMEILNRPGRLSQLEFAIIQGHAEAGYEILKGIDFPWPVAEMVRQHHERLDGSGYPRGLKADEILLESRILAVADVVEAMYSHRPYRPGLGIDTALAEIERGAGTWYDPVVVEHCCRLFREEGYELPMAQSGTRIGPVHQRRLPDAKPTPA